MSSDSTVNAFRAASAADYRFYVSEDAATSSSYSAVHVIVEGAKSLNSYSDAYTTKINEVKSNIEEIRDEREKARVQELTVDTPASLDAAERQTNMLFGIEQDNINRMAEGSEERVQAQADLNQRRAAADQQFADARTELSDLGECTWYIQDRDSITSYSSVESDSSSIEAIATVFPFIFFIVAVLISLTTATRMVEEERTLIGLYKALGYSRGRILSKYVDYALWACLIGGVLGNIIGFVGLPLFLFTVFDDMYSLPQMLLSYDIVSSIVSVALFAVGVVGATIIACRHEMAETPASLMRPKAPRAGSRILLERIGFIWRRMGFLNKVAARNLFRYKKRFFMTVLGVAGCTALLLIGFGIQDSILPIVDKQSGQLTHNDLTISLSDEKALTMEQGLADTLDSSSAVHSWGAFYTKSTTLYNEEGGNADVSIVGAEDDARMTEYFTFRTRVGHDPIPFEEDSVILTEKTALNLGLSVGDTFYVEAADGSRVPLVLTGITENYMFTRLYLSNAQLQALLGSTPEWNTVYGLTGCTTEAEYNTLRTKLLGCNYVSSVSFTEDTTSMFGSLIGSLNYVVVLIIVCAAALAAVVLYNLISVNLAERKKELATIKVLGFYDKEVYRYIFREIELLSLIGSGVGLLLGVPLHRFIILTVEMDQLMFIRTIAPRSYLLAVALTMLFTVVVCFAMRRHVRHISMVESMKAPE